jgi:hypothetical protein
METGNRPQKQATYRIQVQGRLADRWLDWFPGMAAAVHVADNGSATTTLTGAVADQAALRGVLNKLWDLNLSVLTVDRLEHGCPRREQGQTMGESIQAEEDADD